MSKERSRAVVALSGMIRRLLPRIALTLASILVLMLLVEAVLRLAGWPAQKGDASSRESAYLQCDHDSLLGWIFPPDSQGIFKSGTHVTPVTTNQYGLRHRNLEPATAAVRILVLGDSYAFGWGVRATEAFPHLLQTMLQERFPSLKFEVINAGIPGYAVYQQLQLLSRLRTELSLDAVVATFSLANDPVDELRLARYTPDRLAEYSYQVRDPRALLSRLIRSSRLLTLVDVRSFNIQLHLANASDRALALSERSLRQLATTCQADSLPLALVVVPRASEVRPSGPGKRLFNFTADKPRHLVARVAAAYGLPRVDLKKALQETQRGEPLYLPQDTHWNAAGHRATAEAIMAGIPLSWWGRVWDRYKVRQCSAGDNDRPPGRSP